MCAPEAANAVEDFAFVCARISARGLRVAHAGGRNFYGYLYILGDGGHAEGTRRIVLSCFKGDGFVVALAVHVMTAAG